MTTYKFPPAGKTLYGLTTGKVYESVAAFWWRADGADHTLNGIAMAEPDGVTDAPPIKVGGTVSSVEELEALPTGAILRDKGGAWEKSKGCFFFAGNEHPFDSHGLVADGNTLTILWLPGTGEQA